MKVLMLRNGDSRCPDGRRFVTGSFVKGWQICCVQDDISKSTPTRLLAEHWREG